MPSASTPLCRCRVSYIGCSVPTITKDGLQGIQEPLKERYSPNDSEHVGIDARLSIFTNGILLEYVNGQADPQFFPIQNLHYCAAVRYVNVTGYSVDGGGERFLPLDSPFANLPDSKHPPIFASMLRRSTGVRVLECHGFICRSPDTANALVRCCFHAYADSMYLKMTGGPNRDLLALPAPPENSSVNGSKNEDKNADSSSQSQSTSSVNENGYHEDDSDKEQNRFPEGGRKKTGKPNWANRQQSGEYDTYSIDSSLADRYVARRQMPRRPPSEPASISQALVPYDGDFAASYGHERDIYGFGGGGGAMVPYMGGGPWRHPHPMYGPHPGMRPMMHPGMRPMGPHMMGPMGPHPMMGGGPPRPIPPMGPRPGGPPGPGMGPPQGGPGMPGARPGMVPPPVMPGPPRGPPGAAYGGRPPPGPGMGMGGPAPPGVHPMMQRMPLPRAMPPGGPMGGPPMGGPPMGMSFGAPRPMYPGMRPPRHMMPGMGAFDRSMSPQPIITHPPESTYGTLRPRRAFEEPIYMPGTMPSPSGMPTASYQPGAFSPDHYETYYDSYMRDRPPGRPVPGMHVHPGMGPPMGPRGPMGMGVRPGGPPPEAPERTKKKKKKAEKKERESRSASRLSEVPTETYYYVQEADTMRRPYINEKAFGNTLRREADRHPSAGSMANGDTAPRRYATANGYGPPANGYGPPIPGMRNLHIDPGYVGRV